MTSQSKQSFITRACSYANDIANAYEALKGMQSEWNALDYGNTLDDGAGTNAGIAKADVGAVVFATTDAIGNLLASGHATNIYKLRR